MNHTLSALAAALVRVHQRQRDHVGARHERGPRHVDAAEVVVRPLPARVFIEHVDRERRRRRGRRRRRVSHARRAAAIRGRVVAELGARRHGERDSARVALDVPRRAEHALNRAASVKEGQLACFVMGILILTVTRRCEGTQSFCGTPSLQVVKKARRARCLAWWGCACASCASPRRLRRAASPRRRGSRRRASRPLL